MDLPIDFIPMKRRVQRKPREVRSQPVPPPPAGLTLVSAVYDEFALTLTLVFDRAVNIDAFDGGAIIVEDQVNAWVLYGTEANLTGPATVVVYLDLLDYATGSEVLLNATDQTGIVAVDDGELWGGVTNLQLPFG